MKFRDFIEWFFARWCPRRNADDVERSAKPSRVHRRLIGDIDPFRFDLRGAGDEQTQRKMLGLWPEAKEAGVDDLPDVGDVLAERAQNVGEVLRDDELRNRETISGFDLIFDRCVE